MTEGVADPSLASLVQQLDPALFDALPDVLQAAAAEASPADVPAPVTVPPTHRAQMPPIAVAVEEGTLVAGFYRTVEELRENRPSIPWLAVDLEEKAPLVMFGAPYTEYKLDRAVGKALGRIVGFSDGTSVYLHHQAKPGKAWRRFVRAQVAGPFVLYSGLGYVHTQVNGIGQLWTYHSRNVLYLDTGRSRVLDRALARELKAALPGLEHRFEPEDDIR